MRIGLAELRKTIEKMEARALIKVEKENAGSTEPTTRQREL